MYKKVLVAVDFYEGGEQILEKTAEIAQAWNSDVWLVHMIGEIYAPYGAMDTQVPAIDEEAIRSGSEEKLKSLAAEYGLPADNVNVSVGPAVRGILDVAKEIDVDLIVVGSHGRHGLRLLLGSTANGVLHQADRDVLALRLQE